MEENGDTDEGNTDNKVTHDKDHGEENDNVNEVVKKMDTEKNGVTGRRCLPRKAAVEGRNSGRLREQYL